MVVCTHSGILSLSFMMLSYLSDFLMKRIQLSIAFCHMAHLKMPVVTYLFFKIRNHKPKWCFFGNRSSVWRRVQSRSEGVIRSISETNNLINEVEYIMMVSWYNFKAFLNNLFEENFCGDGAHEKVTTCNEK